MQVVRAGSDPRDDKLSGEGTLEALKGRGEPTDEDGSLFVFA